MIVSNGSPTMIITFAGRQELACARSACKRLLLMPIPLAPYQTQALTVAVQTLIDVEDTGRPELTVEQLRGLRLALFFQLRRSAAAGSDHQVLSAVMARLPQLPDWPLPDAQILQFVRLGYGDRRNLRVACPEFMIAVPDRATFEVCLVDGIGDYNTFRSAEVAAAFGPIWGRFSTVSVGRRITPLLKFCLPAEAILGDLEADRAAAAAGQLWDLTLQVIEAAADCGAASTHVISTANTAVHVADLRQGPHLPAEIQISWA
jgi:hypothetical protein